MRNLHHSASQAEIITALRELGHTVVNISRDFTTKTLFFIYLKKKENNTDIFKVKLLLNAVVQFVEPRRKLKMVQCMRFCWYGDTKYNCIRPFHPYKYVGCHDYKIYTKRKMMVVTQNVLFVMEYIQLQLSYVKYIRK